MIIIINIYDSCPKRAKICNFYAYLKLQGYAVYIVTSPKGPKNAIYTVPTPQGKLCAIYMGTIL